MSYSVEIHENNTDVTVKVETSDNLTDVTLEVVATAPKYTVLIDSFAGRVYDDTVIQAEVDLNTAKISNVDHPLVETAVPIGAVFTDTDTDTIYDDTTIQAEVDLNTAKVSFDSTSSTRLANTSGTNTGDQDISGIATNASDISSLQTDSHTHLNKVTLDKFGQNAGGLPTYNGLDIDTTIAQRDVYDGLDSLDNTISLSANNGKVLKDVQDTQQTAINLNTAKVSNVDHPLVETAVPSGAVFTDTDTDTVYDDTAIQAEVDLNTAKVSNVSTNITIAESASTVEVQSSDGSNDSIAAATSSLAGVMSSSDKSKLDSIEAGAEVNVGETVTSIAIASNILTYTDENGSDTDIDLSLYLDDTNLARLTSGLLNSSTGVATFTRDDSSTFTIDMSAFFDAITLNNTLTSTSTTEGLSAAQGKVLKDLIDALPNNKFVDGTDTNDAVYTTGNVGIGNNNPIAKLFVDGGALGGTAGNEVALLSLKTTTTNSDTLQFTSERLTTGTNWTNAAQRIQRKIDATLMGFMQFGSMNDDLITFGEGNTERMRIDGDGEVGIGTTSPSLSYGGKGLQIQNTDTAGLRLTDTTGADFDISARSRDVLLYEGEGYPIRIGVGGNERVRITNDGRLGVGTTSPDTELDVRGEITVKPILYGTNQNKFLIKGGASNAANWDGHVGVKMKSNSVGTPYLALVGNNQETLNVISGKVGIGTANPTSKLQIDGGVQISDDTDIASASKVGTIRYRTSGNNSYADMCMQTGATTYAWINIVQNNY